MTPLLSILLPSRWRSATNNVTRLIDSFKTTASDPACFEVIVRLDHDDQQSLDRIRDLEPYGNVKVIVGSRGKGYHNLHLFANDCAMLSTGRWLGFFNDDAWVDSPGWDKVLAGHDSTVPAVVFTAVDTPIDKTTQQYRDFKLGPRYDFPIISRALYEAAGCWCPAPVLDWFWHETVFQKFPKLGGNIMSDFMMQHAYERGDRLACCDEEDCAIAYRGEHYQNEIRQCQERIGTKL